jgi:hypothetical protein
MQFASKPGMSSQSSAQDNAITLRARGDSFVLARRNTLAAPQTTSKIDHSNIVCQCNGAIGALAHACAATRAQRAQDFDLAACDDPQIGHMRPRTPVWTGTQGKAKPFMMQ